MACRRPCRRARSSRLSPLATSPVIHGCWISLAGCYARNNLEEILRHIKPSVTPEINDKLTAPVTEEEVYQALTHMNVDKSPGPDGFNAGFYKYHWDAIKEEKWCDWVMKCVTSVTYSVLINGSPTKRIYPSRGLRQANIDECQNLLNILRDYAEASGQYVNFQKSAILFGHIRHFWWSAEKQKNKIPWISWSKLTQLKQYGGMGFRDLQKFNLALVAKQVWRILTHPTTLLARVIKAKYFNKSSILESNLGRRPSHAWRSIHQGSTSWCQNTLRRLIHPEDIPLINRIRPRLTASKDIPTWIYTKDGSYSVKSGYHQLSKPLTEASQERKIKVNPECNFCGEDKETITHLLFQCRVSKEIWELSSVISQDASWKDANSKAGIGWSVYDSHGKMIMKGSASIEPTESPLEAEAIALKEAMIHMNRLRYESTTFCGDCASLFGALETLNTSESNTPIWNASIQNHLDDIMSLKKGLHRFRNISRNANSYVDSLAKEARMKEYKYVVVWL